MIVVFRGEASSKSSLLSGSASNSTAVVCLVSRQDELDTVPRFSLIQAETSPLGPLLDGSPFGGRKY